MATAPKVDTPTPCGAHRRVVAIRGKFDSNDLGFYNFLRYYGTLVILVYYKGYKGCRMCTRPGSNRCIHVGWGAHRGAVERGGDARLGSFIGRSARGQAAAGQVRSSRTSRLGRWLALAWH
jgi:hypothetical protein